MAQQLTPTISVIIPAFNEEKLLRYCLMCLKNQDFKLPYEIIVVNGPSTDKTKQIAQQFTDLVIDQAGIGIGAARYQGCNLARGQILAITDADVFIPPNWLTRIYEEFSHHPTWVALTGPYLYIDSVGLNQVALFTRPLALTIHQSLTGTPPISGTNTAIRRSAYFAVGGFDPAITGLEDIELGNRLGKIGKVKYLQDLVVGTTKRRFRHPVRHVFLTLLPSYIKRMVLKKKDKKPIWPKIN